MNNGRTFKTKLTDFFILSPEFILVYTYVILKIKLNLI